MEQNNSLGLIVGENLKRLLKQTGSTQEDFAEGFGVDVRTIRRWIKSGVNDLRIVEQIAYYFNTNVFAILSF